MTNNGTIAKQWHYIVLLETALAESIKPIRGITWHCVFGGSELLGRASRILHR